MAQLLLLLIFLPLLGAIITALSGKAAKYVALISALVTLALTVVIVGNFNPDATMQFVVDYPWIQQL
jgi:NADH-quinone oxidoreductase subunit M